MTKISFVTNATKKDLLRLKYFIPYSIKVFSDYIDEYIILIDELNEEGRILHLHENVSSIEISDTDINELKKIDSRIKIMKLDYSTLKAVSKKYFNKNSVIRCQAGTPLFAFLSCLEVAKNSIVFRSDCDMFFYDKGFIEEAIVSAQSNAIVQPPYMSGSFGNNFFSSRAFFVNKMKLAQYLPFKHIKLDIFRAVHRKIKGRSVFLALEQIINHESSRNELKVKYIDTSFGRSMHICKKEEFLLPDINFIIDKFTCGEIPAMQLNEQHNFKDEYWK